MPRPRTTPLAAYDDIRRVARARFETETDKQLAQRWRISIGYVQRLMQQERERLVREMNVSRLSNSGMIAPDGCSTQPSP